MGDERQTTPWLGDMWELGYTGHSLFGLVCREDARNHARKRLEAMHAMAAGM